MNHNNCDGCFTYPPNIDPDDIGCAHVPDNTNGECPCTRCIIKMMCEEPCHDYLAFRIESIDTKEGKSV